MNHAHYFIMEKKKYTESTRGSMCSYLMITGDIGLDT